MGSAWGTRTFEFSRILSLCVKCQRGLGGFSWWRPGLFRIVEVGEGQERRVEKISCSEGMASTTFLPGVPGYGDLGI